MWDNIKVEEEPLKAEDDEAIRAFEERMRVSLADDHRQFLMVFGEGVLYNHFRIFGLAKILGEFAEFQQRWVECILWNSPKSALTSSDLEAGVIVGDTFNGDELIVIPQRPQVIYYLPQDSDRIEEFGQSLASAIQELVLRLRREICTYPKEEQAEWDLRPVFNHRLF